MAIILTEAWHKKRHFKKRILNTMKKIWDLEFLREQYKLSKEGFRIEKDRLEEQVHAAMARIDANNNEQDPEKKLDQKAIENLNGLIKRFQPDVDQCKQRMDAFDKEIEGYMDPASGEMQGINPKIDALQSVVDQLTAEVKKL